MYLCYSLNFTTNSYFSKTALLGFQYEPASLDENEAVCFDDEEWSNGHK